MTAFQLWETLDRFGYDLVQSSLKLLWQSSILFGAVAILCWILRHRSASAHRAIWVCALCLAPILPFLRTPAMQAGIPQASVSLLPAYLDEPTARTVPTGPILRNSPVNLVQSSPITQPPNRAPHYSPSRHPWALVPIAYVFALIFFLTWVGTGRHRIRRWIDTATPINDARVLAAINRAKQSLGIHRAIRLLESERLHSPVTMGTIRPVLFFPRNLHTQFSDADLRAVAIHEFTHVKQHDSLVFLLVALMKALLFFHPLVWVIARHISSLAKRVADDAVIDATGKPLDYVNMLTRLAEQQPLYALTTEFATGLLLSKSAFLNRVETILAGNRDRFRRFTRWSIAATLVALFGSVLVALAVPLAEKDSGTAVRTLAFPEGRPVGTIMVRDEGLSGRFGWEKYAQAAGRVEVPIGKDIRLNIHDQAASDLSFLERLEPDGIQALYVHLAETDRQQLVHLKALASLQELSLSGSKINDSDLERVLGLKSLRRLYLAITPITAKGLAIIKKLPSLEELNFNYTDVGDEGLKHLESLPSLKVLHVSNAGITDEGLASLRGHTLLRELGLLQNSAVGDAGMRHLRNLTALEMLILTQTSVGNEGLAHLKRLTSLKVLGLGHTKGGDAGLAYLTGLTELERLGPPPATTDAGLRYLAGMQSLRSLELQITEATEKGLVHLKGLSSLRILMLPAGVTDAGLTALWDFPPLEELWIQNSPVTERGLEHLRPLKSLKTLMLHGVEVSDDGYGILKEFPSLEKLYLGDTRRVDEREYGVSDDALRHLAGMTSLKELTLKNTRVTDEGLAHLAELTALERLDFISSRKITDAGLKHLERSRSLQSLGLRDTKVTGAGLYSLLGALPSLQGIGIRGVAIGEDAYWRIRSEYPSLRITASHSLGIDPEKGPNVGDPAPDFSIRTVYGEPLRLADYRGKVTVLYFWSTWCGPCVASVSKRKEIYETFGTREDFAMLSMSLDTAAHAPRNHAEKYDLQWPQGHVGDWGDSTVRKAYGVRYVPRTFLIGKDGRIVAVDPGDLKSAVTAALGRE